MTDCKCAADKQKHDFTKPGYWKTKGGEKVIVYGIVPEEIREEGFVIAGAAKTFGVTSWRLNGKFWLDEDAEQGDSMDLLEPWTDPVTVEGWVNVYNTEKESPPHFYIHQDKEDADRLRNDNRIDCRKIRYVQGKGIVDVTEEG